MDLLSTFRISIDAHPLKIVLDDLFQGSYPFISHLTIRFNDWLASWAMVARLLGRFCSLC